MDESKRAVHRMTVPLSDGALEQHDRPHRPSDDG